MHMIVRRKFTVLLAPTQTYKGTGYFGLKIRPPLRSCFRSLAGNMQLELSIRRYRTKIVVNITRFIPMIPLLGYLYLIWKVRIMIRLTVARMEVDTRLLLSSLRASFVNGVLAKANIGIVRYRHLSKATVQIIIL